jgi:hypothetical protein
MTLDPSTPLKSRSWRRFLAFKGLLVAFSLVGLLASNVANLVSASAHDWMHNALWRVLSIGGQAMADRALANSPKSKLDQAVKAKTAELDAKNKLQTKELQDVQVKNRKLAQQLEANGKQAKTIVQNVNARLLNGLKRGIAALPGEAVPYIGVGVSVGVIALDSYDACQTSKDFNTLLVMLNQPPQPMPNCQVVIPTVDQVLTSAQTEWRTSYGRVRDEAKQVLQVPVPEIRTPTLEDVSKVTCPVVKLPVLCTKGL